MARLAGSICVLLAAVAAGCGSDRATRGDGTLAVVATTTPLADIVRNAGGERVRVTALVPRGADPHHWALDARGAAAVRAADLFVRSGGALDAWAAGADARRSVTLLPHVDPIGAEPHWWLDPVRVERAVKEIRNELARADVDGAGYYEAASADFLYRLRRLDRDIAACLALVTPTRVRLAVEHRALAYFEARYGVRFVRPALATAGRRLWTDTLGPPGSQSGSYLGAMTANTAAIVDALSGRRESCRPHP